MCADMFWMKSWAIKAVCKSSGYKTVEQRLGWRASIFITVTLRFFFFPCFFMFLRGNLSCQLASMCKERRNEALSACEFYKCQQCFPSQLTSFSTGLSCWSVIVCLTVTLMQISNIMSPLNPLISPSHLDWVWQVEEGMDIMDSTNFNETNLSYGLTFWNCPCEWQCQQSPLLKLSRDGACNDGGIKMASKALHVGATGLGRKATPLKQALLPHPE